MKRGVGYAVAIKNLMYSEGFDDSATARCRLADGAVSLKLATAEVGQGFVTIAAQIAREILGVDDVVVEPADTTIGSAGSTSASRQTWMSGGATDMACRAVRERLFEHVAAGMGVDPVRLAIEGTDVVDTVDGTRVSVADATARQHFEETVTYRHRATEELDERGQGACHVAFAFVAQRAVVDVDVELGLVRVIQMATAQDVGRALNPLSVVGQIEGGIAQGLGLAVMEEIVVTDGLIRNAVVHRLPVADRPRRSRRARVARRGARSTGTARCEGRGGAAVHRSDARGGGRDQRRHRRGAHTRAGAPSGHRARE